MYNINSVYGYIASKRAHVTFLRVWRYDIQLVIYYIHINHICNTICTVTRTHTLYIRMYTTKHTYPIHQTYYTSYIHHTSYTN